MTSPLAPPDAHALLLGSADSPTPELSDSPTPELCEAAPADPLASGLKTLLDPTIRQTTDKLAEVYASQQALSTELDRLISQLQHYLDTTDPPALRPTVLKLVRTTKRLNAVNSSLAALQTRINKLYVQLSKQRLPAS